MSATARHFRHAAHIPSARRRDEAEEPRSRHADSLGDQSRRFLLNNSAIQRRKRRRVKLNRSLASARIQKTPQRRERPRQARRPDRPRHFRTTSPAASQQLSARPDIGQWRSNPSAAFFTLLAKPPIMLRIDSRFFACRLRNKRTPRAACRQGLCSMIDIMSHCILYAIIQ